MNNVAIFRKPQVRAMTGLGDSTIRRLVKLGEFPKPVQLSPRAVGWRSEAVMAWIEARREADLPGVKKAAIAA
jgi:prophage regulatory protein